MRLPLSRIAGIALALALTLALPVWAEIGPDAVVPESEIDRLGLFDCANDQQDNFAACLAARGVSQAAIDFATLLSAQSGGMLGLLESLTKHGAVDLATIYYPAAANSNTQVAFVNGVKPVLLASDITVPVPDTRNGRALPQRHPGWMAAGPLEFAGYRKLPDGVQRFTLIDRITDGCRACEVLAISVVAADFRNGGLSGVTSPDWVAPAAALDGDAALAALRVGRVDVLQYRLLAAGYDSGAVDGAMGLASRKALADFLSEHCLPVVAPAALDEASLRVIAGIESAPCP